LKPGSAFFALSAIGQVVQAQAYQIKAPELIILRLKSVFRAPV
jgi:hypothetical protein